MLIAVTSSDGTMVDTHFGKADRFLIYEVEEGVPQLRCEVAAPSYCNWNVGLQDMPPEQVAATLDKMRECADTAPAHLAMPEKLAAIAKALGDCRVVVTAMIGEAPKQELERLGVEVISVTGSIQDVLKEVVKLY